MAIQYPIKQTTPATSGGFLGGLGDVFLGGLDSYLKIREAEKMAEITGEAQYYNNRALEYTTNANAQPAQTANQSQATVSDSGQWINGVDNSIVLLGGAGIAALLLVMTK